MSKRLSNLPPWILRFLGIRNAPVKQLPTWRSCLWGFFGSFTGMAICTVLFHYPPFFGRRKIPLIVSSWGATAILLYGTPEAPLAQPRGVIFGTLISSIIGVAINKMFLEINTPAGIYTEVRWVGAATAIAVTLVVMILTRTVHPPCGATALLPLAEPAMADLGWYYVAINMLAVIIMMTWALILNNIERRYPVYWWKPIQKPHPDPKEAPETVKIAPPPELVRHSLPIPLSSILPHDNNTVPSATTYPLSGSVTLPLFTHIPPGVLNAQEEATLKQIHQKLLSAV